MLRLLQRLLGQSTISYLLVHEECFWFFLLFSDLNIILNLELYGNPVEAVHNCSQKILCCLRRLVQPFVVLIQVKHLLSVEIGLHRGIFVGGYSSGSVY